MTWCSNKWWLAVVILALASANALGFEAYFSDASGNRMTQIWEGQRFYVAVEDTFKSACGVDSFQAEVFVFDYKTGAYLTTEALFVETGYARGVFLWDQGAVPVGDRFNWDPISYRYGQPIGGRTINELIAYGFEHVTDMVGGAPNGLWSDGNWEYVDSEVDFNGFPLTYPRHHEPDIAPTIGKNTGEAMRFQFGGEDLDPEYPYQGEGILYQDDNEYWYLPGRFENHDTLIVLVEDSREGQWGAGQLKIARSEATITTSLQEVYYGCSEIIITIEDKDESLSCDRADFVPFFAIVNPGSWNPQTESSPTNFCALMRTGGVDPPISYTPPPKKLHRLPLYLALVVDESESINSQEMDSMINGIMEAVDAVVLPYIDEGWEMHIAILSFSVLDAPAKQDRLIPFKDMADSDARAVVYDALVSIRDDRVIGATATAEALNRAHKLLDDHLPEGARGVVNLITDGVPTLPWDEALARSTARAAAKGLKDAGYELWTVGIGDAADNEFLESIAGPSPADNFPALTFEDVADAEREKLASITGRAVEYRSGETVTVPLGQTSLWSVGPLNDEDDNKDEDSVMPVLDDPIRWYNIYAMRYIQYPHLDVGGPDPHWSWAPAPDEIDDEPTLINWNPESFPNTHNIPRPPGVTRATFYAQETGPSTGVFRFNFGSLDQLQERLGFGRFPAGTTIAFYYVDPNDFSDMAVTAIHVASPYTRSSVQITDVQGNKVEQVSLGETPLYFRVQDGKMTTDACLQEWVLVHVCDVHGEDDSEYWKLDEVSAAAGAFTLSGGMRLEPVWDAVGGYQLVVDDQRFQAFNADTLFVRYNSVRHDPKDVAALGGGAGGLQDKLYFPPEIILGERQLLRTVDLPYYPWDVSFDTVKVTDHQVFDGTRTTMRLLDGTFNAVSTYRPSDQIYLEVTDADQNEDGRIAERISGRWDVIPKDSAPIWGNQGTWNGEDEQDVYNVLGSFLGGQFDWNDANAAEPAKVFVFNPRTGLVKPLDLMETARNSGVFKSSTGVTVSDLGGRENDILVAFYQDPSNHHDIAIKTVRVMGGVVLEEEPSVDFDAAQYTRGETGTITVTEPRFAGQERIVGEDVLVLLDADDNTIGTWDELARRSGTQAQFRVSFTVSLDAPLGQIRAVYTNPTAAERTAEATARVVVAELVGVTDVSVTPQVLVDEVAFRLVAEPQGAVANRITVQIYDLTRRKVAEFSSTNTDQVTWDGDMLRNTAYIYVVMVEGPRQQFWGFRGVLAIKR